VFGKLQVSPHWPSRRQRQVAKIGGHGGSVYDLAWIQPSVRIEKVLDGAHRIVEIRPEDAGIEFAPRKPVAMLARVHALELNHEFEDLLGNLPHGLDLNGFGEIDEWPDMKASD
jgi:hypothetical protein